MAQGITVYNQKDEVVYYTIHQRNSEYLERENEPDKFVILAGVDDCDPSHFYTEDTLVELIQELDKVVIEAESKKDKELENHIKEIMVLCRFCLWNLEKFTLVISPFTYVPQDEIPKSIPDKFLLNISNAGID